MKTSVFLTMMCSAVILLAACTGDNPWGDDVDVNPWDSSGGGQSTKGTALTSELGTFDVALDESPLSESDEVPSSSDTFYEDYVETFSVANTIKIAFKGDVATIDGSSDGVTVETDGAHVVINSTVKGMLYELSGATTNGSLKIYSEKKFELVLNGVSITNPSGAAINNQGKRAYVVLVEGTENTLCDGTSYTMVDDEDQKGTFFSEGKLAFSGSGRLAVYAQGKNGIVSDDYILIRPNTNIYVNSSASNGLKSNDGVYIRGGVLNIEVSASASKGINTEGNIVVDGGRTTIITTGTTSYDDEDREYKGCAALKADSAVTLNGGELLLKSTGNGGKGLKAGTTFTMNGGALKAIATGKNSNNVSAKAIKAAGDILIAGGDIMARSACHEGMESKGTMTINDGTIGVYAYDDGINSAGNMVVNGGSVYAYSLNNDAIDANGNLTINGGVVIGCGAMSPEEGIDAAEGKTLSMNGGTIIGIGGGSESASGSQQKATVSGISISSGAYLTVKDAKGNNIFALQMPRDYSKATVQLSSPAFVSGSTYTLGSASSASGNDSFYGFATSATVSNESKLTTFTTSTTTSGSMGGGMGWH